MSRMLDIGLSGLLAHNRALEVTSHNIANAATPGYSRQRAEIGTEEPQSTRPGQIGRGVRVEEILRIQDQLVIERLRDSQSDLGRFETLAKTLADVELAFGEPGAAGLSAAIDAAFASLEDLGNNPELSALRAGTLQNLRTFSAVVNTVASSLERQSDGMFEALRTQVAQANELIDQIAVLNGHVSRELAVDRNPNDHLDRRDRLASELSRLVDARVRTDARGMMQIDVGGRNLIAGVNASHFEVMRLGDGRPQLVIQESGDTVGVTRGSIGGLLEMGASVLPDIRQRFDDLVLTIMGGLNAVHATGTGQLAFQSSHLSERIIGTALRDVDLDDAAQAKLANSLVGVPEPLLPLFSDEAGVAVARNLTINVLDRTTGVAEKFIIRYEPGNPSVPASRSLDDLVAAINSGAGGGFTVHPPQAGGVAGVQARALSADGGVRLELRASADHSIDFSPALDTRPASRAWQSDPVQVAGADLALAGRRLLFEVNGANLDAYTLDPITGAQVAYGSAAFAGMPAVIGALTVSLPGGTTMVTGDRFAVDFDGFGAQVGGSPTVQQRAWVGGDAGFQMKGRYTGDHSFDPARPWSLRVVQGGTVGSDASTPIVEVTWYDGPDDSRVEHTTSIRLDGSRPAGSQVAVAEGVYLVFDAGVLSTGGTGLDLVLDGQPDQAGLLSALGINTLFGGYSAGTMRVAQRLQEDSNLLSVSRSRAPGDNSNVQALAAIRGAKLFSGGLVAMDDTYQALVSEVGVRTEQVENLLEGQELITRSLEVRREAVSGVNIDEQVGTMILQQQAYAASARIITMARENIETLMDMLR